jgi:hypothetical protein
MLVGWLASLLMTGRQAEWHPLTVMGQRQQFARGGDLTDADGWSRVPGKVDRVSWWLPVYFLALLLALKSLEWAS